VAFANLCRSLKEGKEMEKAVSSAYGPTVKSLADLEVKWIQYIKNY